MARSYNYCFTLNNWTVEERNAVVACTLPCTYVCFGEEVGETGTPHLQGYAEFNRLVSMRQVKRALGSDRFHLEGRLGSQAQAINYCCKREQDPPQQEIPLHEFGIKKKQGRRTDLDRLADCVASVARPELVAHIMPGPYIRWNKGIHATFWAQRINPDWPVDRSGDDDCEVVYIWGPTRVGKSHYVRRIAEAGNDPEDLYLKTAKMGKWWDDYIGQPKVLMEEFRGNMDFSEVLGVLDKWPWRVQYKGGSCMLAAMKFYVISDRAPELHYLDETEIHRQQFLRRLTTVIHIPQRGVIEMIR